MLYRAVVDCDGSVVVEDNRCLEVSAPSLLFVQRHIHRWLRRTPAVEARGRFNQPGSDRREVSRGREEDENGTFASQWRKN